MPNTSGLLIRKGVVAEKDAGMVALLKEAGAIPIALTNCSELCMWYESSNLVYGRCNSAYHLGRIVGGSSGASALNSCNVWNVFLKTFFQSILDWKYLFGCKQRFSVHLVQEEKTTSRAARTKQS